MTITTLQTIWFSLVLVLLTAYLIFDGFDLGAGFWHIFFDRDKERPHVLKAIGPFWDGNEVWLLTGGGALFAAFPNAYATAFSGFYLALIVVIFGLIARAISIDFRNKLDSQTWRQTFDWLIFLGSTVPALLVGVAMGNVAFGIPLDKSGEFAGNFFTLLKPLPLLAGVTGLAFCLTHGSIYLAMKTLPKPIRPQINADISQTAATIPAQRDVIPEVVIGNPADITSSPLNAAGMTASQMVLKSIGFARTAWFIYLVSFVALVASLYFLHNDFFAAFVAKEILWAVPSLAFFAILMIAVGLLRGSPKLAFAASSVSIAAIMASLGVSVFPVLIRASNDAALNITAFNSSSSLLTLKTMLIITLIGLPFVAGYNIWLYRTFRD